MAEFAAVAKIQLKTMKHYLVTALVASLFFSCEHKETTINPPGENKTTVVNPPAEKDTTIITPGTTTEKKTETNTTITPDGTSVEKKETTEQK
jgi:hypothetical protein